MALPSPQACTVRISEGLGASSRKNDTLVLSYQQPVSMEPSLLAEVAANRTAGTSPMFPRCLFQLSTAQW